ncbi:MAG: hypothetical protein AB7Q76_04140 [Gammaproteobacteria bacterium]
MTRAEIQTIFTDCGAAKRVLIRCPNGHGFVGLMHRDVTPESPEVKRIVRRLQRRKPIA